MLESSEALGNAAGGIIKCEYVPKNTANSEDE